MTEPTLPDTSLLVDEEHADPNHNYVRPGYVETELSKDKKQECRDIVKTINEYGVSQRQKLFLIYLLALELENVGTSRKLAAVIAENHTTIADGRLTVPQPKKILVR